MNAFKESKLNFLKIANENNEDILRPKSASSFSLRRTPTK